MFINKKNVLFLSLRMKSDCFVYLARHDDAHNYLTSIFIFVIFIHLRRIVRKIMNGIKKR